VKKFFSKIKKKLSPLLLIPVVILALIIAGGYFLFFAGDDDNKKSENASNTTPPPTPDTGTTTTLTQPKAPKAKPAPPPNKEFTIDSDRDEKSYALAQATGSITEPQSIGIRIGAAPKQPVTVNWNIVCLLPTEGAKSSDDTFTVTPPHQRLLKLPVQNAVTCTASANAQLTQAGKGRIKVFLIGVRRAGK
jgi:hypothetical protein